MNCWRTSQARHASLLVDCANFYRAIHSSFAKAKKSIFILGWEIDSGTRLLRGEDEKKSSLPSTVLELLALKARQDPDLRIYLLRWDASIAFPYERELNPEMAWTSATPENLQICLDSSVPMGGSHHQKVILIDDELVFTGGMDIARQRWDERDHRIEQPERVDANGPYGPYHDVQIVMDGPVTKHFSELVRARWKRALCGDVAMEENPEAQRTGSPVDVWPDGVEPVFRDIPCAIARTVPSLDPKEAEIQEVRRMYQDLIGEAEDFIYIENQFLASREIARAIRMRLEAKPSLRALLISSKNPQGILEREALWAARIDFKNDVTKGLPPERVRLGCSGISDEKGQGIYKRIHSKVMTIDDRYLVIASSNLNRRSMTMDTECDVVLCAASDEHRRLIARTRDDLIAEHTGLEIQKVGEILKKEKSFRSFFRPRAQGTYALEDLNDEEFTHQDFQPVAARLADPKHPLFSKKNPLRNPHRNTLIVGFVIGLILVGLFMLLKEQAEKLTADTVRHFLEASRHSRWAFFVVCLSYVIGGFILFPVTLMSLITAAVFGSIWGPIYGMSGALLSATVMFFLGRWAGLKGIRRWIGDRIRTVDAQFRETGIIGVAALRMIPVAPFSLVNLAAGISSVRYLDFLIGSFLGFLPAFVAKGVVGDSLVQVLLNPTAKTLTYLGIGVVVWFALIGGSYSLAKHWRKGREA